MAKFNMRPRAPRRAEGGIAADVGLRPGNRYPRTPTRDPQAGILGKLLAGATAPVEKLYGISQGDVAPLGVEWVDGEGWVQSPEKAIPFAFDVAGLGTAGSFAAPAVKNATGMGIRAYHGSPHDFDRFSMDKIGTGEGAQAYGHGLYFAENEAVSRGYRDALSSHEPTLEGRPFANSREYWQAFDDLEKTDWRQAKVLNEFTKANGTREDRLRELRNWHRADPEMTAAIDRMEARLDTKSSGRMYEVNINASPDEFLDWDKPLSEQPAKVREALKGVVSEDDLAQDIPGQLVVYRTGGRKLNSPDAAERLRAAGIKGIRYKDAGSRKLPSTPAHDVAQEWLRDNGGNVDAALTAYDAYVNSAIPAHLRDAGVDDIRKAIAAGGKPEQQTSNFVVFDDSLIDILKKYGIAGLTAGGAGAGILAGSPDSASASQPIYTTGGRFAAGGKTTPMNNGIASAAKQPHDVFRPGEERQLAHGLIKSPVPGRTDQLPITVPKDSYIIPADVISGLGQGNTDAGWPLFRQILAARGVNVPEDGTVDNGPGIDIIAAGGEGVVHPGVIEALGGGDVRKGHKILDDIVLAVRKQTAKRLSSLPGPKK